MRPKDAEYAQARELRRQGYSVREIVQRVDAAKSSISLWVRDIPLTDEQIAQLSENRVKARERTSRTKVANRLQRIALLRQEAEREYPALSADPAFMFGLALYIGEGYKGPRSELSFVNWNPAVVRAGLAFYSLLGINLQKVRFQIVLHPNQDSDEAEAFWSSFLAVDGIRFGKTLRTAVPGSRGKRGQKWPHGGCRITASSFVVKHKLDRWIEIALASNLT